MTWTDAGEKVPSYLNLYRGSMTPAEYLPLTVSGVTVDGYTVLAVQGSAGILPNSTVSPRDVTMKTPLGNYVLPADAIVQNAGYVRETETVTGHGGYITKGDNNNFSDQGYLTISGVGTVEPVQKDWVIGKALFTVPYVGLLPLNIGPVIVIVIILMVLHELWLRRNEEAEKKPQKKAKKQR
jgi:signal peptidase